MPAALFGDHPHGGILRSGEALRLVPVDAGRRFRTWETEGLKMVDTTWKRDQTGVLDLHWDGGKGVHRVNMPDMECLGLRNLCETLEPANARNHQRLLYFHVVH